MDDEHDGNRSGHEPQDKHDVTHSSGAPPPLEIGEGKDVYIRERPYGDYIAILTGIVASIIASVLIWVFSGALVPAVCTQVGTLILGLP